MQCKQCWLIISEVLSYLPKVIFTGNTQDIYHWYEFENYWFSNAAESLWASDINITVSMSLPQQKPTYISSFSSGNHSAFPNQSLCMDNVLLFPYISLLLWAVSCHMNKCDQMLPCDFLLHDISRLQTMTHFISIFVHVLICNISLGYRVIVTMAHTLCFTPLIRVV